jgi:hypothetical protein
VASEARNEAVKTTGPLAVIEQRWPPAGSDECNYVNVGSRIWALLTALAVRGQRESQQRVQ